MMQSRVMGRAAMVILVAAAVLAAGALAPAAARAGLTTYAIDVEHTGVTFKVRHFLSKVQGQFNTFEGNILLDEADFSTGSVTFTIDAASIDTNEPARDRHLKSDAFFDVENHSQITFVSRSVKPQGGDRLAVEGDLTIRGVTRAVTLDVEVLGFGEVYSVRRAAFEVTTTIDRQDFNVSWNDVVEGGGLILGDDVEITINLEAKEQKVKPDVAKN